MYFEINHPRTTLLSDNLTPIQWKFDNLILYLSLLFTLEVNLNPTPVELWIAQYTSQSLSDNFTVVDLRITLH